MHRNSEHILTEWLVLQAQDGKSAAMEQLLNLWYPKFLRYSTQQLRSKEAAKDVVQDTLLAVARKIRRLKDPVAFPRWAYQILHRRGVDYQRSEIRRREKEHRGADCGLTASDPARAHDISQSLNKALIGLGELSYNVIHLRYLHGLSLREIATVCDIPEGTVKSRLHAARGKLKLLLDE